MEKKCTLCSNSFSYFFETNTHKSNSLSSDNENLKSLSELFDDCLCNDCINFLQRCKFPQLNNSNEILTKKGKFRLMLKKKSDFSLIIYNEKYTYPLFEERFSTFDLALKNYFTYIFQLKSGNYSIIKSFEALDEHYRRIFTRVKYELLFY